jgi:hypothetical protein
MSRVDAESPERFVGPARRYKNEGLSELRERSHAPERCPHKTPDAVTR